MGLIFRRSKSFGPLRLTLSKRGLGASIGAGPLRIGPGAAGPRAPPAPVRQGVF